MARNLILGAAVGYEFNDLRPFFLSLERSGYSGDVCLLAGNMSRQTAKELEARGVAILTPTADRFQNFTVNCVRFIAYHSYLLERHTQYENVMMTDVRDVIFQRDPFDFDIGNSFCCFLEDASKTIGTCKFNAGWIQYLFGETVLKHLSARRISCSGTTVGSSESVLAYLHAMLACYHRAGEKMNGFIGDQGFHNYIMHMGLVPNTRMCENETSAVLTLGYMQQEAIRFDAEGFLVNRDTSRANVVHQYDRLPILKNLLQARYS